MKAIKLVVFGMMLIFAVSAQAQISVRLNVGTPPAWGPDGYDNGVRYYYLPDVEAYYDVQNSMFIYMSGNRWIHRTYLPSRYRNYDLYGGYKVVMRDYHGNAPYSRFRQHRLSYARGYRGPAQRSIRDRGLSRNHYQSRGVRDRGRNNSHISRDSYRPGRTIERSHSRSQVRNSDFRSRGNGNASRQQRGGERSRGEGRGR